MHIGTSERGKEDDSSKIDDIIKNWERKLSY